MSTTLWSPKNPEPKPATVGGRVLAPQATFDTYIALKMRIHKRLLDILNLSLLDRTPREALKVEIRGAVVNLLTEEKGFLSPTQTNQLVDDVLDELLGLGPLEPLLKDE